ncbi:MAG: ADOP family duplicated permease [Vicinamibacterales bacterium]
MSIVADARHGMRLLAKAPQFAVVSVLSLALGVAASTTIYSLADALLAVPDGVRDAGRVVDVGRANEGRGFDNMSHPAFEYLRAHTTTFEGLAAADMGGRPLGLTIGASSERVFGAVVSANYFEVAGTRPALGRFFRADEDAVADARPVVVLTHRFWTRRLHADPDVLDRPLRLNNREFAVVGVAEPGFEGTTFIGTDLWMPMAMVAAARGLESSALLTNPRAVWHMALGRLKPGVSRAAGLAELNTLMAQYLQATPEANQRHTVAVAPTGRVPGPMRTPFLVFVGALFALTIAFGAVACSNVAGLLLARAAARRREMATRLAMGASRRQLVTQLLTETAVLFLAGGLVAIPLTIAGIRLIETLLPAALPVAINLPVGMNPRVFGFALGVSLVTAVVFGLAPARHALTVDLAPLLHGQASTGDRRRRRTRQVLVAAQVALSLMLVVTAGLFVRTLVNASQVDPGFSTDDIMLASVDVSLSGFHGPAAIDLVERMRSRLAGLPGVESVAAARMIPLQGSRFGLGDLRVPGYQGPAGDDRIDADWDVVSPGYFETIGMPVVEGRAFGAADDAGAAKVAIVNESFARRAWPGRPAIGQRVLQIDRTTEVPLEIVGVAADARTHYISEAAEPFIYVPLAQSAVNDVTFYVKHAPGRAPGAELGAAIRQVDASVPLLLLQGFDEAVGLGLLPQRLTVWVAALAGTAGAGLAAFGLYGLMAYLVTERGREIAIRLALGASTGDVRGLVLRDALWLGGLGAAAGVALAAGVGTLLRSQLVGVDVVDAASYGGAVALFAATLGLAAWVPARRAARTDAAAALRAE